MTAFAWFYLGAATVTLIVGLAAGKFRGVCDVVALLTLAAIWPVSWCVAIGMELGKAEWRDER